MRFGTFYYSNGDRYEGEWEKFDMRGKGIFIILMETDMKEAMRMI